MKKNTPLSSRRNWLKTTGALSLGAAVPFLSSEAQAYSATADQHQPKPTTGRPHVVEITNDPQLFVDDYLVDNYWGVKYTTETVSRFIHTPVKNEANPVVKGEGGYVNVVYDEEDKIFRMWYQDFWILSLEPFKYTYAIAYAESKDGLNWKLPKIGKYSFKGTKDNNIVLRGLNDATAACPFILDLPKEQRRGYKYIMQYNTAPHGVYLVGSNDGINWDTAKRMRIMADYGPDTQGSIVYDPRTKKYTFFARATNIFGGEVGMRRKVSAMEHNELWSEWPIYPENVMLPDEVDARKGAWKFYGMPTKYYAGIYWGMLWPYSLLNHTIVTELAFSRDGWHFSRFPDRQPLIGLGKENTWDHGMILGSPNWLEVGDEWWLYYFGTDTDHSSKNNIPGIGLARIRKEGFVSLRTPQGGGNIVTRLLRWPGGKLYVNADAGSGEITVKVTGYDRKPIDGFDPEPSLAIKGDKIRHEVKWKNGNINRLKGREIRLEFFIKSSGDVYGFQAVV